MRLKFIMLILLIAGWVSLVLAHENAPALNFERIKLKAQEALAYCHAHHLNISYCILVDMGLPSGVKRFVVWDFTKRDTLISSLVSHGCGSGPWSWTFSKNKPVFSDAPYSHCTALGKYKIGGRAYSLWGVHIKYLLTGLESTNKNAMKRQVVLHSWDAVMDKEIYPAGTPEGWGCPAIANNTMKKVDPLLRKQRQPVLLWIFN